MTTGVGTATERRLIPLGAGSLGVLYLGLVTVASGAGPIVSADEPGLGRAAGAVAELTRARYADEVARITVTLACATLLVGAMLGTVAGLLVTLRDRIGARPPTSGLRLAATLLAVVAGEHAAWLARSVAMHPYAYTHALNDRGGWRRSLEGFIAGRLSPDGVVALATLALVLFVMGPPWAWKRVVIRLVTGWRPTLAVVLGVLAGSATWALAHLPPAATGLREPRRPNLLILASDGVRADRLSPALTPNLSRLASRGVRFERAYTVMPRTLPSWTSILTGRAPHHHGVRSTFDSWDTLAKSFDAVPDRFAAAGYRTAVVSDFAGDMFGRVPLGFQDVHVPRHGFREILQQKAFQTDFMLLPFLDTPLGRRAFPAMEYADSMTDPQRVAREAVDELRSFGDRPFFLTVFFSTTHFPYAAPYPYYRRFTPPGYRGYYKYGKEGTLDPGARVEDADIPQIRGSYDGAVASVDDAAGLVIAELERTHQIDNTIIVVTSDHGESLLEPGRNVGHGEHLFGDEQTHVPLVFVDPRAAPRVDETVVSTVDIAPTLYELAGLPPPVDLDGRSLAPALRGEALASVPAFAESELWFSMAAAVAPNLRLPTPPPLACLTLDEEHGDALILRPELVDLTLVSRHRMVRDERWKLVYIPTRAGVGYELFDTVADPGEHTNVIASEPAAFERMKAALWSWMLQDPHMTQARGYLVPKPSSP